MHLSIVKHFTCLLQDLCIDEESRDYLVRRLINEGPKFLTVTLPALWKVVLTGLETGYLDMSMCTAFTRKKKLPYVMYRFFCQIFDQRGNLRSNPSAEALLVVRQVCEYYYKCSFTFDATQLSAAEEKYVSSEAKMADEEGIDDEFVDRCRRNFLTHYRPISTSTVLDVLAGARPRFGPGSFVRPETPNGASAKTAPGDFKLSRGTSVGTCRHDQTPFSGYFRAYPSAKHEKIVPVHEGKTSEVLFVPKDGRGPRTISREPLYLLKMQMAFLDWISPLLERVTRQRINFADQSINRELARKGSIDRSLATADLKEASDSINYRVARTIYGDCPAMYYFLTKVRSTHTRLPSGNTIRLRKLSGMGSGLTFPLLALTIHIAISTAIENTTSLTYGQASSLVYVYGDDLIVPREYFYLVEKTLKRVGLKLNADKSFSKGFFRESCGGDYLHGKEVVPVRFKCTSLKMPSLAEARNLVIDVQGDHAITSFERHCRELVKAGLYQTAEYLYSLIEKDLGRPLPYIHGQDIPYLGRYTSDPEKVYSQGGDNKEYVKDVLLPVAVLGRVSEPCPYKYLGGFLAAKAAKTSASDLWDAVTQRDFLKGASCITGAVSKQIEDLFGSTMSKLSALGTEVRSAFGEYAERYTLRLQTKRELPVFCLVGRPIE